MFEIQDTETGLSLSLSKVPQPRNPRLVEDNVFKVVTWTRGLGDDHDWANPNAFHDAIPSDTAALFPLRSIETSRGPILVHMQSGEEPFAGYAFATFERLCLEFGLDKITEDIRDETMQEARNISLAELLAYEEYVGGEVYRYEIMNRRGECLEERGDLYGEEYSRHIAQQAFDLHMSVHANG